MRHSSSAPSPSFVDPSSLSLPSPASEASSPQSPAIDPSLTPSGSTSTLGPPRKRARTEATAEEKREARAHRNRIAAQNSRDRRKQQFTLLEDKVRALQQENDQLRTQLQQERDRRDGAEKDKENAELKERVKSLEQGWETVLKALQSQGLPSSAFSDVPKNEGSSSSPSSVNDSNTPPPPSTKSFPVFIGPSPVLLPLSPLSMSASVIHPSSMYQGNGEPTRHLARVATAASPAASLQRMGLLSSTAAEHSSQDITETSADEDSRIEDWFREVMASTDCPDHDSITDATSSSSGVYVASPRSKQETSSADVTAYDFTPGSMGVEEGDVDMDRLLDLLPTTGDEFQDLLASVIDVNRASEVASKEDWNWELTQPPVAVV
ncbi:hypothetical protein K439DRAFT_1658349 [Ramaria rubella]|nr:hypothetical protein K439DRAFT_1658349 [Ramaria rubella]